MVDMTAEYRRDKLQKAIAAAYIPRKVGTDVWNFIGPSFSLKPKYICGKSDREKRMLAIVITASCQVIEIINYWTL